MSSRFQRVRPPIVAQKGISGDFELSLLEVGAKGSKGRWTTISMLFMPADDVIA